MPNREGGGLRVGVLSYRSAPHVGGQGIYVRRLTKSLMDQGCEVTVISGPPYPELDDGVRLVQLPSLDLYAQPHNGHLSLRWRHLLSATDSYEYFGHLSGRFVEPYTFGQRAFSYIQANRGEFDVILDNQTLSDGVRRIPEQLNLPLVTTIHHPITADRRLALDAADGWKQRWLVRQWYGFHKMQIKNARRQQFIVCPSQSSRAHVAEEFGVVQDRMQVIGLGVDQQVFRPLGFDERHPNRLVTTASADVPLKGLVYLIEALGLLLENWPDLELVVIGSLRDGPTKKKIEKLGLEKNIRFMSGLSNDEVAHQMQTATIAVTPSLYEGFGLPAAEAMCCGAPVVVTNGGSLPEVVADAGVVVDKAEPKALFQAIDDLLRHPEKRKALSVAAQHRAREAFSWDHLAPQYVDLFKQAIAAKC